ncbi:MAG: alpha/beta fold hydrolase [Brevundimonas sp.]
MARSIQSSSLKVPGASLYYEVRGQGPLLLIIPGGPQDAGVFADVADRLADHYTVVAFDPRGNSRSPFDGPAQELQLDVQGDDAARLIGTLGQGPAYVFGTSGGAQIGLNLAARHPDRVRALVAHEPPAIMMLDDPSEALAGGQDIHDTYLRDGVDAAMMKFFSMHAFGDGPDDEQGPPDLGDMPPEAAETFARVSGNFEYWLAHGMMPLSVYRPDVAALTSGAPRIVIGLGEQSRGQMIHDVGEALARKLGVEPVVFPGDHTGYEYAPGAFVDILHQTLRGH